MAARIPPNLFGIAFGLSGLAVAWLYASTALGAPVAVGNTIAVLAAATWVMLTLAYLRQGPRQILADTRDPALGPFLAVPVLAALTLSEALASPAPTAARVIVIVLLVAGLLLGGWLLGQWMTGGLDEKTFSTAYFLPILGVGLIGSEAASVVGLHSMAQVYFGIGVVSWVFMSSVVLNRLFFRPRLPAPMIPTLAIEIAPPALAGSAYFLLHPGPPDQMALALAGYAALMVVAQARLLPLYRALTFTPGFWSFTFPWAAMVTFSLRWLALENPVGARVYGWILLAAITGLIGAIAARTIVAGVRGQLLPSAGGHVAEPPGELADASRRAGLTA
ncbi:MAG: tellurite resistance protein [Solirubrobacteraceae bacterium]|nr:tellurite resistance protein [Solirubrobacteraceae bacterium]